jgi:hypothetical protein
MDQMFYCFPIISEMDQISRSFIDKFNRIIGRCQTLVSMNTVVILNHKEFERYTKREYGQILDPNHPVHLEQLPVDCIAHIFKYLDVECWLICSCLNNNMYRLFCSTMFGDILWNLYVTTNIHCDNCCAEQLSQRAIVLKHLPKMENTIEKQHHHFMDKTESNYTNGLEDLSACIRFKSIDLLIDEYR